MMFSEAIPFMVITVRDHSVMGLCTSASHAKNQFGVKSKESKEFDSYVNKTPT